MGGKTLTVLWLSPWPRITNNEATSITPAATALVTR